ncbi:hypothetical protein [Natrinema saccharevitans]|uniref:hypothetical protein n=1 Tax=Natrinema saccharevitans TaxID=301967 RepID=UPI0011154E6E|nr:hypothetical protein [Natrinema saccharevitans]
MVENNPTKRRKVVKSLCGLTAVGLPGVASASDTDDQGEEAKEERPTGTGSISLELSPENMKSPDEMTKVALEATDDTNISPTAVAPGTISGKSLQVRPTQEAADGVNNLDPVGGADYDYSITNALGVDYAKVENTAMLYKSQERDNDGYYHYMMWLWSKAEAQEIWAYTSFTNRVNVKKDSVYLSNWAPTRTIDKNNRPVSIGLEVGLEGGPTISISGSTEIQDGEFSTSEIDTGQSGRHKIKFDGKGSVSSTNAINGVTHFRSQNDYDLYQDELPAGHFSVYAEGET